MLAGKWKDFQWLPSIFESGGYWFSLPAIFVQLLSLCQNDTWQDNSLFIIRIHSEWSFSGDKTPAPGKVTVSSVWSLYSCPSGKPVGDRSHQFCRPSPWSHQEVTNHPNCLVLKMTLWKEAQRTENMEQWDQTSNLKILVQGGLKGQGCQIGSKGKNWEGIEIIQETSNKRWR